MRILTFNWHTPYLSLLVRLDHEFEVAPPNIGAPLKSWDHAMRPMPPNVKEITTAQASERLLKEGHYDLLLAHNVKDIVMAKEARLPKLLVFHNRLSTEAALGGRPEAADGHREQVKTLTSLVYRVFISETKRADWDMPGEIILPGVDVSQYGGYTGEQRRVLRVGNSIKARDLMTGFSLQEEVLKDGLPNVIVGENPDIPESRVSAGWEGLKKAYRENRLLLSTAMPPWEDGYNLAVLEAMATGMPVAAVENPTCPITGGVDGFIGATAEELREKVLALLDDADLAKKIGAEGRKTVERLFPLSAFLEKWSAAIRRAVEWRPAKPRAAFPKAAKKKVFKPSFEGAENVLLSYTSYPATTGAYLERAMRKKLNVVTAGAKLPREAIAKWDLGNMKTPAWTHDIDDQKAVLDMRSVIERLPEGFAPDFFVWVETGIGGPPAALEALSVPKAAYLIDTHIHLEKHIQTAKMFDVVFLAQRAYIPNFSEAGVENVHWLPLACDPEIHGKIDVEKKHDVGFVGSLTDERRTRLLMRIAERTRTRYDRLFLEDMARFFCQSRIVFNNAIKNDLNMRVFEALCSGSMLLTDDADGLRDFFTDRESLVIYDDENAAELAEYYIEHEKERERIAAAGRRAVLEKHTYAHRVDEMMGVMRSMGGGHERDR
ncbi:MAG: glycosyltransferase family protein [Candidatus Nitrospinota bacterium M3_3B_026]